MSFVCQNILSTEQVLLEPICKVKQNDGYTVYRSKLFPSYYDGNLVFVNGISEKDLSGWESIFKQNFDPDIFKHKNFQFVTTIGNPNMLRELKGNGYHCCYHSYMTTAKVSAYEIPEGLEIKKYIHRGLVKKPKKARKTWKSFKDYHREIAEIDWYYKEGFRKLKYITRSLDIEWFVLRKKKSKKIVASLGIFLHEGLARFQDVKTREGYRRMGYATLLVKHAIKYGLKKKKAKKVVVCAEANYHAVDLYGKCGFKHQFDILCATKYP